MFDIGLGELLVLAVVGLLVFGPEKLPKAAADAGRMLRTLREMATGARRELAESAGLDLSEAQDALRSVADLHPKRLAASLMSDDEPTAGDEDRADGARPGGAGRSDGWVPTDGTAPRSATTGDGSGSRAAFDPDAT
ncbi:MAG: Sec-independent protein translocase protein TatB [Candidatus Nanopelagicales bacterium]